MRKLTVINHVTLDGVMQAPARPDEDTRGGFSHGGWALAGNDEVMARFMGVGTTTLMHTINPEMVLFGGAMTFGRNESPLGRRFIQEIRNEVKKRAFPIPAAKTAIEYATLGGDAGYIGAAGCARLKFGNPQNAVD